MSADVTKVRLIRDDEPGRGSWNMGLDEALVGTAIGAGKTLRFYRWEPATLSLGYFQSLADRESHTASRDCPVVRRSTGGGAILHHRELTYSFACPAAAGSHGAAEELYDLFHDTLRDTLRSMGAPAERQLSTDAAVDGEFLCFRRRSRGDLICGDAKIVGSAQRRVRGGLLQHGSILLATSQFAPELPGIEEVAAKTIDPNELIEAWTERIARRSGWSFAPYEWNRLELAVATESEFHRYMADSWTSKR